MDPIALFAYDIHLPGSRARVCRALQASRLHGQYSVHACALSATQAQAMLESIAVLIDPVTDHLLLAWVHAPADETGLRLFT
ncbi:MAG: CRISPR-associated endonuclease Cas2 [Proteobacteria bacterium]|nr:CRISPR-associated endonuclease Cas2 [Pseudomonadota bacterium]MBS0461279.1 CRISPR-associated endonuclease Cas2 [Pseudomonadota bacterium]MBS0465444.1 CRISPR-associated endonuclease Cas2 [Pseudomonadota bacterium]